MGEVSDLVHKHEFRLQDLVDFCPCGGQNSLVVSRLGNSQAIGGPFQHHLQERKRQNRGKRKTG